MRTIMIASLALLVACGDKDDDAWGTVGGSSGSGGDDDDDGSNVGSYPSDQGFDLDGDWVPTTNAYFGQVVCGNANGMWAVFGIGLPGVEGTSLDWEDVEESDYAQAGLYFKEKPAPGEYLVREAGDYNRDDEPKELKREGVVIHITENAFADEPDARWEVVDESGYLLVEERSDGVGASFKWGRLPIEEFGGGDELDTEGGNLDCLDY